MDINEMARKLAKELEKDQDLKGKTLVFLEDKLDVLNELNDEFVNFLERWDEKYSSLSDRMQESSRGEKIEERSIGSLRSACSVISAAECTENAEFHGVI